MTIREIQKKIADALNGVEELVQGGCKALAEDANDVFFEVKQALEAGSVCIVVVDVKRTPVIHTLYKNKPEMGLGASIEQSSALQRMRHVQHAEPGT